MNSYTVSEELESELAPFRQWIKGRVLNAGCGRRYVDLGEESIRLDFDPAFATAVDLQADVHFLPFADQTFDTVVSVAVLEHTRYAWEVAKEFHRVLQPGGFAIVVIPFIQPGHGVPQDFVRFSREGIQALMEWADFKVHSVHSMHPLGFNTEWILREIFIEYPLIKKFFWPIRRFMFPQMRRGKILGKHVEAVQSAYCVIAEKIAL